jgi:hypothetical protein
MALSTRQLAAARLAMGRGVPSNQIALAQQYGRQYGIDPRLLLAIGGHETHWGTLGAGRQGYTLGYGATDTGLLNQYAGVANQYRGAAKTLAGWGARSIGDVLAGKASRYATDPGWERGVAGVYRTLGGDLAGGLPTATAPTAAVVPAAATTAPTRTTAAAAPAPLDRGAIIRQAFLGQLQGKPFSLLDLMRQLREQRTAVAAGPPPYSDASPPNNGPEPPRTPQLPRNWRKYVKPGADMDRAGVATNPAVFDFVGKIGSIYGRPLTIGTGSNHPQYVKDSNRVSDHWYGLAADIPMVGSDLTRLGQDALIAAGMSEAQARKVSSWSGGNYNGYNILFNTNVGGNHYNHLHVGLGRILGRPK